MLLVLAEELGGFAEYVGGKEWAWTVLGPLENLAAVEETLVRDKASGMALKGHQTVDRSESLLTVFQAADSISKITVQISQQALAQHFLPLLQRLSGGDWFTSRTSACALFAAPYPNASNELQSDMRRMFQSLCSDDTPMVRRAAAKALGVSCAITFSVLTSG